MPIITTLLTAFAVASFSPSSPALETMEMFTLTSEVRQELRGAMLDFERGDRSYAEAQIRGLLLDQVPSVGIEDKTSNDTPVLRAVETWRRSLSEAPFRFARPGEHLDITVHLVSQIDGRDDDQGEVTFGSPIDEADGRFHAEILVLNHVEGRPITRQEEQAVITHELGHVLGLEDSEDGTGLMGMFDPENVVLAPTTVETRAVVLFRRDLHQVLEAITG